MPKIIIKGINSLSTSSVTFENLFKLRAKVEWIVDKLEECGEDKEQMDIDLSRLKILINEIETKVSATDDAKVAEYIENLEKYVAYLEKFAESRPRSAR